MSTLRERLTAIDLIQALPGDVVDELITRGSTVTFPPGASIVEQGATESGLHVLLSGDVEVLVDGRTVNQMGPGDYFGEISLIDGAPRAATVRVGQSGAAKTFRISPLSFHEVVDNNPAALRALLSCITGRLRAVQS